MLRKKKGQSTLEYGLIIAVVVAALLAINYYMKKGMQGKLKESTDSIGRQFAPETFSTAWQSVSSGNTVTTENRAVADGSTTSNIIQAETVTRGEYETFGNVTPVSHY